ncbi:hypothetical protein ANABIO32_02110 [Rossellomorea marisflavi]|uniref:hypothetical protein n=1 Tax=Rossellomorea marisflavi TaxID=189381 RepID=UPI0025C94B02|nr:hypothetical protein [Rossellomorea marisflavi]GLI82524.1 hypothetical protein ANABIO32_02110 [Rossellomorea marisflavi]
MSEEIQFLKDLQEELLTQDNDCQAAPRFWSIMNYRWIRTEEGEHERASVFFTEECELYQLDDLIKEIIDGEVEHDLSDEDLAELKEIQEWESEEELFDWYKKNINDECYLIYETEESFIAPNSLFLTKAEAKRHLELNHYHYSPKAHTYAMTAWRAPKVEKLISILESFNWDKLKEME